MHIVVAVYMYKYTVEHEKSVIGNNYFLEGFYINFSKEAGLRLLTNFSILEAKYLVVLRYI